MSFDQYHSNLPDLIRNRSPNALYRNSVFATFDLAIARAAKRCPAADKLMRLLRLLRSGRYPLNLISKDVMSETERGEAVRELVDMSLLTHSSIDGAVTVHRLVQDVMRGLQTDARELSHGCDGNVVGRAGIRIRVSLPRPRQETKVSCRTRRQC